MEVDMTVKVGIPRGLMYYYYYPLWQEYFTNLGGEVLTSPKTNKAILDMGVKSALDETCLPVKVFYGHVAWLKDKVDYIFIPRLISVEWKEYICPKFMGLPDMIRANISGLPAVIDTTLDMSKSPKNKLKFAREIGLIFTSNPWVMANAWKKAVLKQKAYETLLVSKKMFPEEAIAYLQEKNNRILEANNYRLNIALLGHGYNIYDSYISMSIINKLRERGVNVYTADLLEVEEINNEAAKLPKRMFWTFGRKSIGGASFFLSNNKVDGMIHVASFGCGPDSMVGELILRQTRRNSNIPILTLTIDEHSGEAGVVTRLEAFLDMLSRRVAL
jgi:predicted nucleotide-binding protein (sugar kinase/HSP70/actin superfamily)